MPKKPPNWNDDAALTALVGQHLSPRHAEVLFPETITVQTGVPWKSWDAKAMERESVDAARQGDFRMLGWMLYNAMPLKRETMALAGARLMGKLKGKTGAAKQTIERRRAANPVHDAADEVPKIKVILKQLYPGQRNFHNRAIDIAAARAGIDRDRLAHHLNSKHKLR
jgi:hypothetical protein